MYTIVRSLIRSLSIFVCGNFVHMLIKLPPGSLSVRAEWGTGDENILKITFNKYPLIWIADIGAHRHKRHFQRNVDKC